MKDYLHVCEIFERAAEIVLEAGLEAELGATETYGAPFDEAIKVGKVSEGVINKAVRRVFWVKFRKGCLMTRTGSSKKLRGSVHLKSIRLWRLRARESRYSS